MFWAADPGEGGQEDPAHSYTTKFDIIFSVLGNLWYRSFLSLGYLIAGPTLTISSRVILFLIEVVHAAPVGCGAHPAADGAVGDDYWVQVDF
ncbi:hypothetical protein ACFLV7_01540 [Chloroflexota bacterium]